MKRRKTLRTIIIFFFIILAVYYIYPSFTLNSVEELERSKVNELSEITGMDPADIYSQIYDEDIDLKAKFIDLGVSEENLAKTDELVEELRDDIYGKLVNIKGKAIKQGLDLQGGMHMVLEVNLVKLLDNIARKKDDQYYRLVEDIQDGMKQQDADFYHVIKDVFNRSNVPLNSYFGDLRSSEGEIISMIKKEAEEAINRLMVKLTNRVDKFGVSEPTIQKQGSRRIVVQLPGIQDPARARSLIKQTALLEFKLLADADKTQKVLADIDRFLRRENALKASDEEASATAKVDAVIDTGLVLAAVDSALADKADTTAAEAAPAVTKESADDVVKVTDLFGEDGVSASTEEGDTSVVVDTDIMEEHPFYSLLRQMGENIGVPAQNRTVVNRIIHRRDVRDIIPSDYKFHWSMEPEVSSADGKEYYSLYLLKRDAELTGALLRNANVQIGGGNSPGAAGQPMVSFELNRQGARIFSRVTGANIGKYLAIVLDDKVFSSPVIKSKIPNGQGIIEGNFDMQSAQDLTNVLEVGALPAPVDIIEERTVGPSLGHDSVTKGTFSAIAGLVIVVIFMLWYYRLGGVISDIALALNLLFVMAILAGFHGTLTLPGIAGIILTIGMAVDANVLIFERIREELRTGKTVKASIDAGYGRAIVTILDANITTLIAGVVLYQFGTGPIKGFALTLMIGIIASMFTAIVVTRAIFDYITNKYTLKTLKI
jgi:preprotein translocase subunit SecD